MAAFQYQALSRSGQRCQGVLEADSARQARQLLRDRQLAPLSVQAAASASEGSGRWRWRAGISVAERALLTRQLATLVQAALPVEDALRAVAAQAERPALRALLMAVRGHILEGHGLATAMARHPSAFPLLYRNTVAAGERGQLGLVLEQLADYTEASQQARQKVQLALLYPLILLLVSLLIVGFLLGYVVPGVIDVFTDSGQPLPLLTRALVMASDAVAVGWPLALVLLVAAVIGVRSWRADPQRRLRLDAALLRVPVLGPLLADIGHARFAATLAILERSGVPLVDALRIASAVVGNLSQRRGLEAAQAQVLEGAGLTSALEHNAALPPMLLHMIAAGERSGQLGAMLQRGAANQQALLSARMAMLVGLFEPLMLLAMGAVVLLIVLAILLPILSLNQLVG